MVSTSYFLCAQILLPTPRLWVTIRSICCYEGFFEYSSCSTYRKPFRMQQLACSSFNNLANICSQEEHNFSRKKSSPFSLGSMKTLLLHLPWFKGCNLSCIKRDFLAMLKTLQGKFKQPFGRRRRRRDDYQAGS